MSSDNPTGMSIATAIHYRRIVNEMELYNRSNHNNSQHYHHHQSNAIVHGIQPKITFAERFVHHLFH